MLARFCCQGGRGKAFLVICCSNICCILVVSVWNRWKGLGIPPGKIMPPCGKKGFMPGGSMPGVLPMNGGRVPIPKGLPKFSEVGVVEMLGEGGRDMGEGLVLRLGDGLDGERICGEGESWRGELGSIDPPCSSWWGRDSSFTSGASPNP